MHDGYHEDLAPYGMDGQYQLDQVHCVGWLSSRHDYTRGDAPRGLVDMLTAIFLHSDGAFNSRVHVTRGVSTCALCDQEFEIPSESGRHLLGMSQIWIPSRASGYFASPSLIIHYMTDHRYLPPAPYIHSVLEIDTNVPFNGQEVADRLMRENLEQSQKGRTDPEEDSATSSA